MTGSKTSSETSEKGDGATQPVAVAVQPNVPAAPPASTETNEAVGLRLDKYRRSINKLKLYAAALGTGITFFSAVKFAEGTGQPFLARLLSGLFLTLALVAAALIVRSYGRIQLQLDLLNRYLATANGGTHSAPAPLDLQMTMGAAKMKLKSMQINLHDRWPADEKKQTRAALGLEIAAFLILLFYVWIPVLPLETKTSTSPPSISSLLISVHFGSNRAAMPVDLEPVVRAAARGVKGNNGMCFRLEGHADLDGPAKYNLELSRLRADAVRAVLESEGLQKERISVVAYGVTWPQAEGASESAKAQNRRIDIFVQPCVVPAK
jgi:outer membrane protein OmpA-like peptidoglycan-associated protein